jgi:rSAM/selenodomain-associated transferase 1
MRQALAVAAKAPQPGTVKTRLHSRLSADDATELYRCFLKDTLLLMDSVPQTEGVISYTPRGGERYFDGIHSGKLGKLGNLRMLPQRGESFGDKLHHAFEELFGEGFDSVVIIDADSPTLPRDYLTDAFDKLARPGERVVLGPAEDGGYYLIGLRRPHRRLFEQITWSSDRVLAETLERAREIALDVSLLPMWYDVDDSAALERLRREVIGRNGFTSLSKAHEAPHTRRFIEERWPYDSDER